MKLPTIVKRKKLRAATAARRSRSGLPAIDYEEMAEPNMKLSRALLIVLLLHVVAVAGIIAFNTIKTRETVNAPASVDPAPAPAAATPIVAKQDPVTAPSPGEIQKVVSTTKAKPAPKTVEPARVESSARQEEPARKITTIADSGKIYTVVKGDNPVTIAHHFHVDYEALLQLNDITDPRKLQIGTKLHIPERGESSKHKSD
ncbi:MAG TPA: LysM domain-containing protein [Chthoniobacterales bacterium]|jgi:LysM repeat protein|nr:LysM domain-containing protein [Chthoniobacterales bacterium]